MEVLKLPDDKQTWALGLLGFLMAAHLSFLGFGGKVCHDLVMKRPELVGEQCKNATQIFQRAAETYVAIILALMAPLPRK